MKKITFEILMDEHYVCSVRERFYTQAVRETPNDHEYIRLMEEKMKVQREKFERLVKLYELERRYPEGRTIPLNFCPFSAQIFLTTPTFWSNFVDLFHIIS